MDGKKVNKKAVITAAIVIVVILCVFIAAIFINNSKDNKEVLPDVQATTVQTETLNNSAVQGFFPGGVSSSASTQEDATNSGSSQETTNNDKQELVCGLKLPYNVPQTTLTILQIGQYSGPFVEDGSDKPNANMLSILVKNNSDKAVEFAKLSFKLKGSDSEQKDITFNVSLLPANATVLVMEAGCQKFNSADTLVYSDNIFAELDTANSVSDKVSVVCNNSGELVLTNNSNEDLGTVYVRYKSCLDNNIFLGGITYSVKFENVKAGSVITKNATHYSKNQSKVLVITV